MGWQTRLDRSVLREIDSAHADRKEEVGELIQDLLRLKPGRVESYFPLGYAEATLGLRLDAYPAEELDAEASLWHRFGATLAALHRNRKSDEEEGEAPDLSELLQHPRIAKELLPVLLKQSLAAGDLEQSVKTLEIVLSSGAPDEEAGELLRGTLSEILRRAERPREKLETSTVLDLLQRCMDMRGFGELPNEIRAPFHRTLGKLHQHVEEYDQAAEDFRRALDIAGEGHTLGSVLHFDLAACLLGIRGVPDLVPDREREDSAEVLEQLELATSDPKRASFNAHFTRGILRFEKDNFDDAASDFRAALERIEMYRNPLPVTLARMRYFLALSLLRSGRPEDREEAVHQLEKALERIRPEVSVLEEVLPHIEEENPRVAGKLLSRIDVSHGADPETIVRVGEHYRRLGDADGALKVAQIALERTEDVGLRKDALLIELRAYNMQGFREDALDTFYELRDLCYRSGDHEAWERVVFDDDCVGQVLDKLRVLSERVELLGRVGGRDQERFDLLRQIATSYLDRAEPHWKQIGLQVLIEADSRHPGVFDADLEEARSMAPEAAADTAAAREAAESMGSPPKILVLGGDEHQDRREDDLSGLEPELGIESEWIATDYVRPDRILEKLGEQFTTHPPDGLLILHWNRNELVRDVRKLCRTHRVSTRFCYFAGISALEAGLADLVNAVSQRRGEAAGA